MPIKRPIFGEWREAANKLVSRAVEGLWRGTQKTYERVRDSKVLPWVLGALYLSMPIAGAVVGHDADHGDDPSSHLKTVKVGDSEFPFLKDIKLPNGKTATEVQFWPGQKFIWDSTGVEEDHFLAEKENCALKSVSSNELQAGKSYITGEDGVLYEAPADSANQSNNSTEERVPDFSGNGSQIFICGEKTDELEDFAFNTSFAWNNTLPTDIRGYLGPVTFNVGYTSAAIQKENPDLYPLDGHDNHCAGIHSWNNSTNTSTISLPLYWDSRDSGEPSEALAPDGSDYWERSDLAGLMLALLHEEFHGIGFRSGCCPGEDPNSPLGKLVVADLANFTPEQYRREGAYFLTPGEAPPQIFASLYFPGNTSFGLMQVDLPLTTAGVKNFLNATFDDQDFHTYREGAYASIYSVPISKEPAFYGLGINLDHITVRGVPELYIGGTGPITIGYDSTLGRNTTFVGPVEIGKSNVIDSNLWFFGTFAPGGVKTGPNNVFVRDYRPIGVTLPVTAEKLEDCSGQVILCKPNGNKMTFEVLLDDFDRCRGVSKTYIRLGIRPVDKPRRPQVVASSKAAVCSEA